MSQTIFQRLQCLEDNYFAAVNGDATSTESFHESWLALERDINRAQSGNLMDEKTQTLAHAVSTRVLVMTESIVDFQMEAQAITSSLEKDLQDIFDQEHSVGKMPSCASTDGKLFSGNVGVLL